MQRFSLDVALDQSLQSLSGGQKTCARLAALVFEELEFILLDVPMNHFDLEARSALEAALCGYDGALLVVSHDLGFLDAIGIDRQVALT